MKIKLSNRFLEEVSNQIDFISIDKPIAASNFYEDLIQNIRAIVDFPYKHRKSIYSEDSSVRDLIFKGYTVTYKIDTEKNQIEVFSLIKQQLKK